MPKTSYPKPFFPKNKINSYYPYSEKQWKTLDCYEICRLGGGDFFFIQEHINSGSGTDCLAALDNGTLLADWMEGDQLHWDKVYDKTCNTEFRVELEKHVWLNRLYFLLPIAQSFFCSHDESRALLWFYYFNDWVRQHPFENQPLGSRSKPSKHVWVDMQITFRLIILIHCVFLLAKSKRLTTKHWRIIHDSILLHAQLVHEEIDASLSKGKTRGNHFLQKASALFYVGALFPEFENSSAYLKSARQAVSANVASDFFSDGCNVESCPAYGHFIARFLLDSYLLLKNNNLPPISGLEKLVKKSYQFLEATITPAGLTAQFSDSFAADAVADIRLVRELITFPKMAIHKSICFKESGMAILRKGDLELFVDAMPLGLWHHHEGKPNILLFVKKKPLLIDSGSGSYDRFYHWEWLKTAGAHNAVSVCFGSKSRQIELEDQKTSSLVIKEYSPSMVLAEHKWVFKNLSYTWLRRITLEKNEVLIVDTIQASKSVTATIHFHFAPLDVWVNQQTPQAKIKMQDYSMATILANDPKKGEKYSLQYHPALGCDNRICVSPELTLTRKGEKVVFHTKIQLFPSLK